MEHTLGHDIDRLHEIKARKSALEEDVKALAAEIREQENALLARMQAQGVDKLAGKRASASISKIVKPHVVDWDAFYAFIYRHKYAHLLERRPSSAGCLELFETKGKIPGVEPFVQDRLNVRSVT